LEGAGAGPSQRTGTRLGGVVSCRVCRLVLRVKTHNTVEPVEPSQENPHGMVESHPPVRFSGKFSLRVLSPLDRTDPAGGLAWMSHEQISRCSG